MPRTTTYTDSLASEICRRMAAGETLGAICRTDRMPARYTVLAWLRDPACTSFLRRFEVARDAMLRRLACELVDLREGQVRHGRPAGRRTRSEARRMQLRIDALEWFLEHQSGAIQQASASPEGGRI